MPDRIVVRRDIVLIPQRCNIRRVGVINDALAAEIVKAVVILEHDYEHMIELRNLVFVVVFALGPRSGHAGCERQSDCKSEQTCSHSHRTTLHVALFFI